ncbi:MAG: hypothetical protein ACNA8L_10395 [Luteolibacter sp.]
MLTEETAARIDYSLACIQLAQRLRDLPKDHPLAIAAADEGIEPIDDYSPPSIGMIAKYAGLSKSTVRSYLNLTLARAQIAATSIQKVAGVSDACPSLKTEH